MLVARLPGLFGVAFNPFQGGTLMKALRLIGLFVGLALVLPRPAFAAGQDDSSRRYGFDFGDKDVKKENAQIPLKAEDGKEYKWTVEMKPFDTSGFSSPQSGDRASDRGTERSGRDDKSKMCKHETTMKVNKASEEETSVTFTFDASDCPLCKEKAKENNEKAPSKLMYDARIRKDGEIEAFRRQESETEGGAAGKAADASKLEAWDNMLRTHARQLIGAGLHGKQLEPGKSYDVAWMHHDAWSGKKDKEEGQSGSGQRAGERAGERTGSESQRSGSGAASSSSKGMGDFALRYEGKAKDFAHFTIVPSTGSFSSPSGTEGAGSTGSSGRTGQEGSGSRAGQTGGSQAGGTSGSSSQGAGQWSGSEYGKANFRLDDGLLDKFAFMMDVSKMGGEEHAKMKGMWLLTIRRE